MLSWDIKKEIYWTNIFTKHCRLHWTARSVLLDRKERVAENKNHNKENDTNKMIFADCCKLKKKVTVIKNADQHFSDLARNKNKAMIDTQNKSRYIVTKTNKCS